MVTRASWVVARVLLGCSGWLQSVQSGFYHVANGSGYNVLGGCQDVVEWLLAHAG